MIRFKEKDERGDAAVLAAIGIILAALLTAAALDLSGALFLAAHERNALSVAKDSVSQADYQLVLKNTDDWSASLSERITSSVKGYGFKEVKEGDGIRIAMREVDPGDQRYRCIIWSAEVTQTYQTTIVRSGLSGIPVTRHITGTIVLYSNNETYGRAEGLKANQGYAVYSSGSLSNHHSASSNCAGLCTSAGMVSAAKTSAEMQNAETELTRKYA